MIASIALVILGFALLVAGAEWLVGGSSKLAKRFGVSDLVIGLTIVAFGTSTPELVVSLLASLSGSADVSLGNVVGSNTCNILLILGLSALIAPLTTTSGTVWKEIPFMILAGLVLLVQVNDIAFDQSASNTISRSDSAVMLLFFGIFLVYIFQIIRTGRPESSQRVSTPLSKPIIQIVGGLAALILGAQFVVNSAVEIATSLGVSEALVGLTIVAVGTSLPELATSMVAAYRKNADIAVGNIVGSNIFNVFFILGISGLVAPLPISTGFGVDLWVMMAATFALFLAMFIGKPYHQIQRSEGVLFLALYAGYTVFLINRG